MILLAVSLSACGTKEVNYSFEEAKTIALDSPFLDALLAPTANQQDLSLTTTIVSEGSTLDLALATISQSDPETENGTAQISLDANITGGETSLSAKGVIEALVTPATVFFNLKQFAITSPDPSVAMITSMVEGFKEKWFQLSLSGAMNAGNSTYKEFAEFRNEIGDLYVEQGSNTYEGTFSQFNGNPAYQFTLNTEKLENLIKELLQLLEATNQDQLSSLGLPEEEDVFSNLTVTIPTFEGNLVILGDKNVAEVVDTFEVQVSVPGEDAETITILGEYRLGQEGFVINLRSKEADGEVSEGTAISINVLKAKSTTYTIDIKLGELLAIKGTATVAKNTLAIDFDLEIEVISDLETDATIIVPLKGSRAYKTISSVKFEEPTDAVDLMEMLGGFLGATGDEGYLYDDELGDEYLIE
ncbi:MAG: hypothetical protein LBO09_03105 [Candidatus Peribacteria bacterium]|nr:hypothetical protein [Candidatus Peribacteria bacterium]